MNREITQLENIGTWKLTELLVDHKPIKCKWILKVKRDHTGAITHYKGCLVAKDFLRSLVLISQRLLHL